MNTIGGIPIDPVIRLLVSIGAYPMHSGRFEHWATWFAGLKEPGNSVIEVMPQGTSELRARAFMRVLGAKGLVTGCHCGCRGDYVLTDLGVEYVESLPVLH